MRIKFCLTPATGELRKFNHANVLLAMLHFEVPNVSSGSFAQFLDIQFQFTTKTTTVKFPNLATILGLVLCMLALSVFISIQSPSATARLDGDGLPLPQTHPLPESLARWEDETKSGDYFEEIDVSEVSYLIWSQFPIQVCVELPDNSDRAQEWVKTVLDAVGEWESYLPLEVIEWCESADIVIINKRPPLRPDNMRARSAEVRYKLYVKEVGGGRQILSHQFVIWLSPMQTGKYLPAAARHEFGHALGIWGHSPLETDVMYYSQVREPPPISPRDINTLKRIYQQPTQLGWEFQQ